MKTLTSLMSAAALAVTIGATALPSHAAVIAQFQPKGGAADYRWVKSGGSGALGGTGGHFFSTSTGSGNVVGAVSSTFSFLDPAYIAIALAPVKFTVDATAAAGNGAIFNPGAGTWTQTGLNGTFSIKYNGPTHTYGAFTLVNGENLLSGVFTDAWIQGAGGSGSTNVTIGNGGAATYNSAVFDFSHAVPGSEEFAFNLLAVTPHFNATPVLNAQHHIIGYKALNSFRANGGGNFSADFVPEPAAWTLMILGFGGVGAALRRRRQAVALA